MLSHQIPGKRRQDERYKFLPRPSAVLWQARFSFADGPGTLSVKVGPARHAKKEEKEETEFLVLELTARGLPAESPLDGMAHWFSRAHEWIVRGFEDLTTPEAQRELWGKHA